MKSVVEKDKMTKNCVSSLERRSSNRLGWYIKTKDLKNKR